MVPDSFQERFRCRLLDSVSLQSRDTPLTCGGVSQAHGNNQLEGRKPLEQEGSIAPAIEGLKTAVELPTTGCRPERDDRLEPEAPVAFVHAFDVEFGWRRFVQTMPDSAQRPHLEKGLDYSVKFARFLLESGNVVDTTGAILTAENLPAARQNSRAVWRAVLVSLEEEGETPDAEIARCLLLFGHDW